MRFSRLGYWGASLGGLALAIIGVVSVMVVMPSGVSWAKFIAICGVVVVATTVALYAYRNADEIILNEHKTAWFWGSMVSFSTFGPLIVGVAWQLVPMPAILSALARIAILHRLDSASLHFPHITAAQGGFIEGITFVVVLQLAVFLALLAWLHLRPSKQ